MNPSAAAASCAVAVLLSLLPTGALLPAPGLPAPAGGTAAAARPVVTAAAGGTETAARPVVTAAAAVPATRGPAPAASSPEDAADRTAGVPAVLPRSRQTPAPPGATRRPARRHDAPAGRARTAQERADARGARALERLPFPADDLGYSVAFRPYRGAQLGVTDSRSRSITVFVKDGQSDHSLLATLAHEVGHALDFVHGDGARRHEYRGIRGLPQRGDWFPCSGCRDYASDAGDWAEVFAYAVAGAGDFRSERGPAPTAAQLEQLRPLFRVPPVDAPAPSAPPSASPAPSSSPAADREAGLPELTRG